MATTYIIESGTPYIKRRTEKGWTLDFVFNRQGQGWGVGSVFYYWGISGETIGSNYADNNLSFQFTNDARIIWKSLRYVPISGVSGYTENYVLTSGQTPILCIDGTSEDFNITVTFERYMTLTDCGLTNSGGLNDLVLTLTENTSSGSLNYKNWLTGDTVNYLAIQKLNTKWFNERSSRLGVLKIYLNGNPIYKLENFEEIIPSERESNNNLIQSWGGGTTGIQNIHFGTTGFNLKNIQYFEQPLNFLSIQNHYKNEIKPYFNIVECDVPCTQEITVYEPEAILYADGDYILTQNNTIIIK